MNTLSNLIEPMPGQKASAASALCKTNTRTINGDVRPAAGEINHDGDLHITQSIRAGASVKASGSIVVDGSIESAHVKAGGTIYVGGSILGGVKSLCSSGRNMQFNSAHGANLRADGDIIALSEVIGSRVIAGRSLKASGARVQGGHITVNGEVEIGAVGGPDGVHTLVEAGIDERLRRLGALHGPQILANRRRFAELQARTDPLANSKSLTVADKELVTELLFEASETAEKTEILVRNLSRAAAASHAGRKNRISVAEVIYAGVVIRFDGVESTLAETKAGPLMLCAQATGDSPSILCAGPNGQPAGQLISVSFVDPLLADLAAAMK